MLDVYVFFEALSDDALLGLNRLTDTGSESRVRRVSRLYGAFEGLAAIEVSDYPEAEPLIDGIRNLGISGIRVATAIEIIPPTPSPLHGMKLPVEAFSAVKCEPSQGRQVFEILAKLPATQGVALTTGATDIVLELGADTYAELSRILLDDVAQISGIAEITSSLKTFEKG